MTGGPIVAGAMWDRKGVTREVFLIYRWAIKIPKITAGWKMFLCGLMANMQEREFGRLGWEDLCPVTFSLPGGWLVVMRRAEPMSMAQWRTFDPEAFTIREGRYLPVEHKPDSFGTLGGRVVAIDYGN